MELKIENSLLNSDDKRIIKEIADSGTFPHGINKLSIISNKGCLTSVGSYDIYSYDQNAYYDKILNLWMDDEFKIIQYSNVSCFSSGIEFFIDITTHYLRKISSNPTFFNDKELPMQGDYISISKWFNTYGHVLDELCCIKDYMMTNNLNTYIPFISMPMEKNIYNNSNYKNICDTFFDKYFNAYAESKIIKVNKLTLIKHEISSEKFHSFPIQVTNLLKQNQKVDTEDRQSNKENFLFITRGRAQHLPRNLENQNEIEEYLHNNRVDIYNPEIHSIWELLQKINLYNKIIITWGGALVNLSFCNKYSEIIILKSASYGHEKIKLFNKIINSRKLKIKIIESIDNVIDPVTIL
tara:strand:+ start:7363 stop:8421 length:1059 start_codon:yes stop_codon:yes gene_type:complete